jgi:hypothetical protein
MTENSALLTVMLETVDHDLSEGPSPISLWYTLNGRPVLDGGPYPDENPESIRVIRCNDGEMIDECRKSLARILASCGLGVRTEDVSNA